MSESNVKLDTNFPLKIDVTKEHEDGSLEVSISYGEDFKEWFMEREGLKRWSHARFQKVVGPLIENWLHSPNEKE